MNILQLFSGLDPETLKRGNVSGPEESLTIIYFQCYW